MILLTYYFILTLTFSGLGGGGTIQAQVLASTEALCRSARRAVMAMNLDGHASVCYELNPNQPLLPERD